jgi:hypothetical protein
MSETTALLTNSVALRRSGISAALGTARGTARTFAGQHHPHYTTPDDAVATPIHDAVGRVDRSASESEVMERRKAVKPANHGERTDAQIGAC